MNDAEKVCAACPKRDSCTKQCKVVKNILNGLSSRPFIEKWAKGENGPVIYSYPTTAPGTGHHGEYRFSDLENFSLDDIPEPEEAEDLNIPEPKEALQSRVFYLRFFKQMSYPEIAAEVGSTPEKCRAVFYVAKQTLTNILKYMDAKRSAMRFISHNKLPKEHVWFICNRLLGVPLVDLSHMVGLGTEWIGRCVRQVERDYQAHRLSLRRDNSNNP